MYLWLGYSNICNFSLAELEKGADDEQIKIAYRRLAKFYHPDGWSLIFCGLFILLLSAYWNERTYENFILHSVKRLNLLNIHKTVLLFSVF